MDNLHERYERQIALPQLGEAGQKKLFSAKVLVVGAGGLGCPALQYLAGAGVGMLGIMDDDIISLNNLHRQLLYSSEEIGLSKATIASKKIEALNPATTIHTYNTRLTNAQALKLFPLYDLVLDCTDNFATRYLINDACALLKKTLVFGAINRFEGQVAVFNHNQEENIRPSNYRDLFPVPPSDNEVMNCAEAGVLGVLPGVVGTMMATETIKLITGIGEPLINKILLLNLLNYQQSIINIPHSTQGAANLPPDEQAFLHKDYVAACNPPSVFNIGRERLFELLEDPQTLLVDVRELHETPVVAQLPLIQIPLSVLHQNFDLFEKETIILFCQSGKRSLQAAALLTEKFGSKKKIFSLQNGVTDITGPVY
ncbi:HesA/MoeB/ThiF family protein [Ferruginibacter sp. HRS2-29]|uniref:HesA/MoeB/ThiF family protein n=1 Tax=Ferruginibacter sp. HRS2-29 TaxID=2487334 RepID=UPI0020CEB062|nr:HesA/MoeB/ThiF family protein [Ferruginibacter sp. HRS2-29]MCP9750501.1 molybdopterin-synthase adenylyltransferase MoeB [Ferruginibacter sp. HRS2-29]